MIKPPVPKEARGCNAIQREWGSEGGSGWRGKADVFVRDKGTRG